MQSTSIEGRRALRARGRAALLATLAMGLWAMAWPSEAGQSLAYVSSGSKPGTVSVIDTGDSVVVETVLVGPGPQGIAVTPDGKRVYVANTGASGPNDTVSVIETASGTDTVVATIRVGRAPHGVAVTPDGKRVYVANGTESVSVIDTNTNAVVTTILLGLGASPFDVAVTPDGKHAYVTNTLNNGPSGPPDNVLVIATTTNAVVATVPVGSNPHSVAVTPDGKHVYVANLGSSSVSAIDTISKTVSATVSLEAGVAPFGLAVTPDGKHVYVANTGSFGVSPSVLVIDTATNTVAATVPVGGYPFEVSVTPDGKHVYVTNTGSGTSVIDTATNMVTATVGVSSVGVGVIPSPQGVQFLSFNAKLGIQAAKWGAFKLQSQFTLSSTASNGIHPDSEPVKLQVGPFITTISAGSFRQRREGSYTYKGVIDGVRLEAQIEPTGTLRYAFQAEASGANLARTSNPVQVSLSVGDDAGLTSVKAHFDRRLEVLDRGTDHRR